MALSDRYSLLSKKNRARTSHFPTTHIALRRFWSSVRYQYPLAISIKSSNSASKPIFQESTESNSQHKDVSYPLILPLFVWKASLLWLWIVMAAPTQIACEFSFSVDVCGTWIDWNSSHPQGDWSFGCLAFIFACAWLWEVCLAFNRKKKVLSWFRQTRRKPSLQRVFTVRTLLCLGISRTVCLYLPNETLRERG